MNRQEIENLSFEDALQQLELIVRDLESGRIKLDEAVEAYEKAAALKKMCETRLKEAQLKIEAIEKTSDGELILTPLDKEEA
jgi:exodeoxyribonuclease VII small subunit